MAFEEPEKTQIIHITVVHDLLAPEVLPFEIGNALTAMMKKRTLEVDELTSAWDMVQAIPVELRRIDIRSVQIFEIRRNLIGPNGIILPVCTIWMTETAYKAQRFFRDEAIHEVCRVAEKLLQRIKWDFLRHHQYFNFYHSQRVN